MKIVLKYIAVLILFFILSNCQEELYISQDYVYVGEFTESLEGPAVDQKGNLYFVNPDHVGSIGVVDQQGNFSIFIDQLPEGSTANGIRINQKGELVIADYTGHNILKVDPKTKEVSVYSHSDNANQPNDLTLMDDIIYASDPNWKEGTGNVWKIENGQFENLLSNMGTTNGIEVSPDQKTLYVNESVQRKVWAFTITSDGGLSNKRELISFEDFGMDGMRCDVAGNLYITRHGKGSVVKVSPRGKILKEIVLKGKKPSNIAFGGAEGKTAYITLQDRGYIEQFKVDAPGNTFTKNRSSLE
ncbi:MAG: SMP-30/gluconolactonase/LRE family protein [Flavobacteriaceae bacterium]